MWFRLFLPSLARRLFGYTTLFGFFGIGDNIIELSCLDDFIAEGHRKICVYGDKRLLSLAPFYPQITKYIKISPQASSRIAKHSFYCLNFAQKHRNIVFAGYYLMDKKDTLLETVRHHFLSNPSQGIGLTTPKIVTDKLDCPSRAILVLPKSNFYSSEEVQRKLMTEAMSYAEQGYTVFVNGKYADLPVEHPNVRFTFWTLEELVGQTQGLSTVIGIRTGLMDLLVFTGVHMKAYYGSDPIGQDLLNRGFGLSMWNRPNTEDIVLDR